MRPHPLTICFRLKIKSARLLETTKIRINSACTYLKLLKISQAIRILVVNLFLQRAYTFLRRAVVETVPPRYLCLPNSIINKSRSINRRNFKIMETF